METSRERMLLADREMEGIRSFVLIQAFSNVFIKGEEVEGHFGGWMQVVRDLLKVNDARLNKAGYRFYKR